MDFSVLREIGLTETEVKIYLCLLSVGATSVGKIVEQTGCYRKNVYDALNRLVDKGLVVFVFENKIKFFQAKNPDNLLRFLEFEKNNILKKEKKLKKQLPLLKKKFQGIESEIEAEIFRGTEGIKTILKDCLNYNEVLLINATGEVEDRLPFFWPQYNKKREDLKILWKLLLVFEARNRKITKSKYYEFKILPKEFSGPHVIYIFGENVANILWLEKPLAFVVKHNALAENYRKYFEYLWKSIK